MHQIYSSCNEIYATYELEEPFAKAMCGPFRRAPPKLYRRKRSNDFFHMRRLVVTQGG